MSATIQITARGQYAVIVDNTVTEETCSNLRQAIKFCILRGYQFAFGWEGREGGSL